MRWENEEKVRVLVIGGVNEVVGGMDEEWVKGGIMRGVREGDKVRGGVRLVVSEVGDEGGGGLIGVFVEGGEGEMVEDGIGGGVRGLGRGEGVKRGDD